MNFEQLYELVDIWKIFLTLSIIFIVIAVILGFIGYKVKQREKLMIEDLGIQVKESNRRRKRALNRKKYSNKSTPKVPTIQK